MLLNVVCFFSLGVCGWIVSLCSGCVGCCAFCLICDACSCKCWCIGSTFVSSCRCCVLVSCVHPVAILRAVFCTICSLSMFVSDALGDHMVEGFFVFAPLGRGEDFQYVDSLACFGCC